MNASQTQLVARSVELLSEVVEHVHFQINTDASVSDVWEFVYESLDPILRPLNRVTASGQFTGRYEVIRARVILQAVKQQAERCSLCSVEELLEHLQNALAALSRGLYDL